MTAQKTELKVSQDFELLLPQQQKAYPISKDEWTFLKEKVKTINNSSNIYHTIGSVFLGITGSALLAVFTYDKPNPITIEYNTRILITISAFIVSLICGICLLVFGGKQKQLQEISAAEVIQHMELIEKRYAAEEDS
ncbi:MAG TPA: hypothetical protein PKL83_00030 [bacterium]|nr:hypothetical protein [bacterium]